jgi:predicted DNA-binding transcriptional regulator AlpA
MEQRTAHSLSTIDFDLLPDCAFVRQPVVEMLFACSPATVWRYVKTVRVPRPLKLSHRVTVWNVGQLRAASAEILKGDAVAGTDIRECARPQRRENDKR